MDYKEKYKQALGWMRDVYPTLEGSIKEDAEHFFPELKESEDERIRNRIIGYLKQDIEEYPERKERIEDMLAWLEKQGEQNQKHFELKAGHWYICHRAFCCRADHLTVKEGERFMCEKDGVVKGFVIKEPEKYFKECSAPAPMEEEQKPAEWSEEVERLIEEAAECLRKYASKVQGGNSKVYVLSLADRIESFRPQTTWKPSDEQMDAVKSTVLDIAEFSSRSEQLRFETEPYYKALVSLYNDLEKLKENSYGKR